MKLKHHPIIKFAAATLLATVTACTTYVTPPSLNAQNGATLNGSRYAPLPNQIPIRAEPEYIDGQHIFSNVETSDRSLLLSPGPHTIKVLVARYTWPPVTDEDVFNVNLEAGKTYTLKADFPVPDVDSTGHAWPWPNKSYVWIETSGVPITHKLIIILQGPPPQPVIIPIFIH
jgi:hypothetical protein